MRSKLDIREILQKNAVTVMFVVLCIIGLICSGQTVSYVMYELFGRLSRNAFIVLALIIPIVAGMGINFAITIGAMAAQIAALWVIEWGISGLTGFLVAMLMTMPIAAFFGYLIGKLMNKMKGQEMIGGLILGYFANGLYQLLFLFIFGNLIPLKAPGLVIKGSTGVANTIDLSTDRGFKYALDGIISFTTAPLKMATYIGLMSSFASIVYLVFVIIQKLAWGIDIPGYATIITLILFLGGMQLFSLGIIGEYIGRNYIETKNRPIYIAKEILENKE